MSLSAGSSCTQALLRLYVIWCLLYICLDSDARMLSSLCATSPRTAQCFNESQNQRPNIMTDCLIDTSSELLSKDGVVLRYRMYAGWLSLYSMVVGLDRQ